MFLTKLDLNKHNIWKEYLKNHENKYNIYVHPYEYYNSTKIKVTNSLLKDNIIKNIDVIILFFMFGITVFLQSFF